MEISEAMKKIYLNKHHKLSLDTFFHALLLTILKAGLKDKETNSGANLFGVKSSTHFRVKVWANPLLENTIDSLDIFAISPILRPEANKIKKVF